LRPRHLHRELRLMLFALRLHGKTNIAQIYLSVKYRILAFFYGRGGGAAGGPGGGGGAPPPAGPFFDVWIWSFTMAVPLRYIL
jgi:hypothetical protein